MLKARMLTRSEISVAVMRGEWEYLTKFHGYDLEDDGEPDYYKRPCIDSIMGCEYCKNCGKPSQTNT